MGEFFKGWRRKIGVVALVMACVFIAGWVRSFSMMDFMLLPSLQGNDPRRLDRCLVSWDQCLVVLREGRRTGSYISSRPYGDLRDRLFNNPALEWKWSGFGFGSGATKGAPLHSLVAVPYWSIVIPLTLISAYLLLSKPRSPSQKTTIEPTAAAGS